MASFQERFGISFIALISVVLGVFMAILDSTVVNVAIPKMMSVFAATQNDIEWVLTAYLLVTGMLTPISGYLGDRFGQKRIYMIALAIFTIGSALCGLSWSTSSIIIFRVIQAVGGAMLMPVSMTILFSMSKPERRGTIMGIWGIALMFAPALGPTLSGYLVEYVNWRLIFYINVPVGIVSLLLVAATIPAIKGKMSEKLDVPGFATSLIGFFCILYALSEAPTDGWGSITIISFLVAGLVFLALFVAIELTATNPMLDLRLLKRKVYLVSLIASSLLNVAMLGVLFILPIFLQDYVGLSPLQTGLLVLPGALITGVLMPISGNLFDRIGARPLALIGLAVMALTTLYMTELNIYWTMGMIVIIYMLRSAGMGLAMMPISTAGMNDVPRHLISRATALQNTTRNVAGSIGTAYLSTVMQTDTAQHLMSFTGRLSDQALQSIHLGGSMPSVFGATSAVQVQQLLGFLQQWAFTQGMKDAFFVAVIFAALAWVSVLFIGGKKAPVGTAEGAKGGSSHMAVME
ncbi:MAG: DHA2 family efflux MFS transporter permease subunit [Firmicutes bacterium]|nr:DHA2 family efflux MFS transporter permease subunit [Bacillota bacterium]